MLSQLLPPSVDLAFGFEAKGSSGPSNSGGADDRGSSPAFVVRRFEGREALFEPFEVAVDLASDDDSIDLTSLLDTPAVLSVHHAYDETRYLHGVIAEVEKGESGFHRTFYRAVLKPVLHRMQYHSDSRIFQEISVPDIVTKLFEEHGVRDVEWRLEADHLAREYCVQYQETSYDFVRRLLAEEGICFFFEHRIDGHKMILTDAPLAMPRLKAMEQLTCNANPGGTQKGFWVSRFVQTQRLRATHSEARDYSFKQPAYHQQHKSVQPGDNGAKPGQGGASHKHYELYDYPGRHKELAAGLPFTDHRLEAHRTDATQGQGQTNCIQLSAGFMLELTDHNDQTVNATHRLLAVHHKGEQPVSLEEEAPDSSSNNAQDGNTQDSSADGGPGSQIATTYHARFTTQPANLPYRPTNPNPRPRIEGPQIAHVTGPSGEEIYCDEHGRIKLWFPWDRHGKKDETSSCWIRVSQNWAGGSWGHMAIPRIGQEVVVEYLEGDPDQPILTGRTYHATNKPPYKLPENKTRMTIKSDTHKGTGFNELRFEDEAEREEIFQHAERDMNEKVKHNKTRYVGNSEYEQVDNEKILNVGSNYDQCVSGSLRIHVGDEQTQHYQQVNMTQAESLAGVSAKLSEDKNNDAFHDKAFTLDVVGPIGIDTHATASIEAKRDVHVVSDQNTTASAGKDMILTADQKLAQHGKTIELTALDTMILKCGASKLVMHSDGKIYLIGDVIRVDSSKLFLN